MVVESTAAVAVAVAAESAVVLAAVAVADSMADSAKMAICFVSFAVLTFPRLTGH